MKSQDQRRMTLALGIDEGPVAALDTMVEAAQIFAAGKIPDQEQAREALDTWGIEYEPGEPILRTFTSAPALRVKLPPGWQFSRRGGGGHHDLLDERGASRLHWHIHGWDPISVRVSYRYSIRRQEDISATVAVIPIYDGPTVIHTIPVTYPHPRINDPNDDGTPYYKNGWDEDGWTKPMHMANYEAKENAEDAAKAWLDENRPNHRDALESWG